MYTGEVVTKTDKGFGFIKTDAYNDGELFFHATALSEDAEFTFDDIAVGEILAFDIEEGPKGFNAVNIMRSTGAAASDDTADAGEAGSTSTEEEMPGEAAM